MVGQFTNKLLTQGEVMESFGQSQYGRWGASWTVILHGCVMVSHFTWVRHYASPCYKRVCTVCAIYSRHGERIGHLNMQTP